MTNYVAALVHLVPEANISYKGAVVAYENIRWLDERTQPSKAECEAVWPLVEYTLEHTRIKNERSFRYASETDGIFFDAMREGADLSDWVEAVNAIKAELPYPAPVQA